MRLLIRKTNREEWANAATHGLGLFLSFLCGPVLFWKALETGDPLKIISVSVFGFALLFVYSASTLYHLVCKSKWKQILQVFDHIGIYLLIAGTYTPISLWLLNDAGGAAMLIFVWLVAIAGIIYKVFLINRYPLFSTILYLGLGWTLLIKIDVLMWNMPYNALLWLFVGGAFYTIGVIFFLMEKVKFSHAIWHLFVLGGSLCHILLVYFYVV